MGNENSTLNLDPFKDVAPPKELPMPDQTELNEQFKRVLDDMDLTPDKINELHRYDNARKWELICEQNRQSVGKNNAGYFQSKLRIYLRSYALHKKKFRKVIGDSTKTLRELEISLRTNHVGWMKGFIEAPEGFEGTSENTGLDLLSEYLSFALYAIVFSAFVDTMEVDAKAKNPLAKINPLRTGW